MLRCISYVVSHTPLHYVTVTNTLLCATAMHTAYAVLRDSVPCRAVQCRAAPCLAVTRRAAPRRAKTHPCLLCILPCPASHHCPAPPCATALHRPALSCHAVPCRAVPCPPMPCRALRCFHFTCHTILSHHAQCKHCDKVSSLLAHLVRRSICLLLVSDDRSHKCRKIARDRVWTVRRGAGRREWTRKGRCCYAPRRFAETSESQLRR